MSKKIWSLLTACVPGRKNEVVDWVEIRPSRSFDDAGDKQKAEEFGVFGHCKELEEFELLGFEQRDRSATPTILDEPEVSSAAPCVCSPVPSVCSPAPSLFVCSRDERLVLESRPRKELPPVAEEEMPSEPSSKVKSLIAAFEKSSSSTGCTPPRPSSPPPPYTPRSKPDRQVAAEKKKEAKVIPEPVDVEAELRNYQYMKRRAKFDQRARILLSQRPSASSSRYRSPSYPPNYTISSPFRSLQ